MHTVYILHTKRGTYYVDQTSDIDSRTKTHILGHGSNELTREVGGSNQIVYTEDYETKEEATIRVAELKQFSRQQKIDLVNNQL